MKIRHLLLAAVIAFSFSTPTFAGVADTPHNLGTSGTGDGPNGGQRNSFSGTGEICVFCHTPHGGDTSAIVPLWNRTLSDSAIYITYDQLGTSTLDGAVANVGSISIACLSCHDGTQAMDSVINQSGSGLVNSGYEAGVWSGDDVNDDGTMVQGIIQMLGTDLQNDHPIGIQYGGGGITSNNINGQTNDADFFSPDTVTVNGDLFWYVDADNNGQRDKTDVILFTRPSSDFGGGGGVEPSVECASCHDPHGTDNETFLRVTSTGSRICLTCHNK